MDWLTFIGMIFTPVVLVSGIVRLLLAPIKKQVDNHIPTQIDNMKVAINGLNNKTDNIRTEMHDLRTELNGHIESVRTELNGHIESVRTELNGRIESVRTELKEEIRNVRAEAKEDIAEVKQEVAKVQESIKDLHDVIIKYIAQQA